MAGSSLIFEIIGVDRASHAFDKVSKAMRKTEDRSKKLKIAGGLAMAALAVGAVEFGKKSVDKFQEVGGETLRLQRILGGTATQVSRLRFAGEETGVAADKLSVGFGILSKHLTANDKAWKSVGINAKDADGKIRPMSDLIPDIADKFAKMPAGPQKTALAMQLFGKSGKDLLPFLNRGKEGLAALGEESDKFGTTLNDKDTAEVKKNIIAKRQLNAAISGLQIQLGQHLVPAIAAVVIALTGIVLWFSHLSGGVKTAVGVAAGLVAIVFVIVKAVRAWTAVQAALNVVMSMNPIALVVIGIALLVAGIILAYKKSETFRTIVKAAFHGVQIAVQAMWGVIKGIFSLWLNMWFTIVGAILNGAAKAFGWVPGIGPKLKGAAKAFNKFRDDVNRALNGIPDHKVITIVTKANLDFVQTGSSNKRAAADHRAGGGPVRAGQPYVVGEQGPELFVPGQSGGIVPNGKTSRGSAGGGGNQYITVNLTAPGDDLSQARRLVALLQKLQQSSGKPLQIRTA